MLVHGSRKSAIQGKLGNSFFNPNPIKCIECGGPVVIIASIGFDFRYFVK